VNREKGGFRDNPTRKKVALDPEKGGFGPALNHVIGITRKKVTLYLYHLI
jgi:hypothetical protein